MNFLVGAGMSPPEFLETRNTQGMIVAPAGCGKTELLVDCIARNDAVKPILVLTHTNAGVTALASRLKVKGVLGERFRLFTIDGWAMRMAKTFPVRAGIQSDIFTSPHYPSIRGAAVNLLSRPHLDNLLLSTYSHLLVDEYQDCSTLQHRMIDFISRSLVTTVFGDPLQAIFNFDQTDPLANWSEVALKFPQIATLNTPWRWRNANNEVLGHWLLQIRQTLLNGQKIDLRTAPDSVTWVQLDGVNDHRRQVELASAHIPANERLLILGNSRNRNSRSVFASQSPGTVVVEPVDLGDLINFCFSFDANAPDALSNLLNFMKTLMTNLDIATFQTRMASLSSGRARTQATIEEASALSFLSLRSYSSLLDLVDKLKAKDGVRLYRPAIFHAFRNALSRCVATPSTSLHKAAVEARESNRHRGRPISGKAVGSTLLLKGLEAERVLILDATNLDARNLYVALTRGSKHIRICSASPLLPTH